MTDQLLNSESYNQAGVENTSGTKLWHASYGDLPATLAPKYGGIDTANHNNSANSPLDANGHLMPSPFVQDHNSPLSSFTAARETAPSFVSPLVIDSVNAAGEDHSWRSAAEHSVNLGVPSGSEALVSPSRGEHLDPSVRAMIEDCFHLRTNMDGFIQTGGYIGGISGLASWGLDQYYKNLPPEERPHQMKWWQPVSPMLKNERSLQIRIDKIIEANGATMDKLVLAEPVLNQSSVALHNWQTQLRNQLEHGSSSNEWLQALERQSAFVNEHLEKIPSQKQLNQYFDSREQVLKGNAVFVENSEESRLAHDFRAAIKGKNLEKAAAIKSELTQLISRNIETAKSMPPMSAQDFELLKRKNEFVRNIGHITDSSKILEQIGTPAEIESRSKLFAKDSHEARLLTEHAEAFTKYKNLLNESKNGASELAIAETALGKQVEKGAGSWVDATFHGVGRGLFATGSAIAIGYCFDKAFGHDAKLDASHLISDGFVLPAILGSGLAARVKVPAVLATAAVSRLADLGNKHAGSADFGSFMRPNWVDAFGATAIGLSSIPLAQKCAAGLGVLTLGRVYNGLAETFDWSGARISMLEQHADSAFAHDHDEKSAESFRNAVDKEKEMGLQLDDAIRVKWDDWQAKENQMDRAEYLRGEAILFAAIGQARLSSGSRLDPNNHDMSNRILKKYQYDFGGEAAGNLRTAAKALVQAQNHVLTHPWTSNSSQNVYVMQLRDMQAETEAKLSTIYGAHDIDSIYDELQKTGFTDLLHAMAKTRDQLMVCNSSDKRYIAKLARDLALGDLVNAARPNADSSYIEEAQKCLRISVQMDPSAPDNSAITMIANRLVPPRSDSVRF